MVYSTDLHSKDPAGEIQPGFILANKYKIHRLIASGGMGFVYLASNLQNNQHVALKIMRTALQRDNIAVERFKREIRTIKRLMHPNTIELLDFGVTPQDSLFLVMEWLKGKDLKDILKSASKLSPLTAAKILTQVAWSLSEAHAKGIIHRDLKPENIFILHNTGSQIRVKVLDFGLAKAIAGPEALTPITRAGVVCGTPEYMSPEQARGENLDSRSDIYALGCVLFTATHGYPPFKGKKPVDVAMKHIHEPFPPIDTRIPEELVDIITKATQKNPALRYQTVEELADKLQAFIAPHEINDDNYILKPTTLLTNQNQAYPSVPALLKTKKSFLEKCLAIFSITASLAIFVALCIFIILY